MKSLQQYINESKDQLKTVMKLLHHISANLGGRSPKQEGDNISLTLRLSDNKEVLSYFSKCGTKQINVTTLKGDASKGMLGKGNTVVITVKSASAPSEETLSKLEEMVDYATKCPK